MRAGEEKGIAALFAGLDAVTIDGTTGELAGERLRRYRRSHVLELGDALIGASTAQYGEQLATFNRRHYPGDPPTGFARPLSQPDSRTGPIS